MTPEIALELIRDAMLMTFVLSLPILATALVVGVLVSLGQAVTQLQEQTLSFVPKLIAMVLVLLYALPWGLSQLGEYTIELIRNIPHRM